MALPQSFAVSDQLLPRRYQEEIFARAQEGNIIAALDTGSGKTFISTLLMKWIASRPEHKGKLIIFLVPKVPLVEQQADFVERQTPLRVARYYGSTAWDMTNRGMWRRHLNACDVIVMTAQIWLNLLMHSHWSLDKVSLIVIDECHHARKNHAYNGIMHEYFQWPPDQRPKIFGMTASPIWNPKNAAESLATLERNMDAKVYAVLRHADEMLDHIPKPKEVLATYGPPPPDYPTYPSPLVGHVIDLTAMPMEMDLPLEKIAARYHTSFACLGPFGAEYYLWSELKVRISQLTTTIASSSDGILEEMTNEGIVRRIVPKGLPEELARLSGILDKFAPIFEPPAEIEGEAASMTDVSREWCTPQVQALVDALLKHYNAAFQCIVFVEQRHIASALAVMLGRLPELRGKIRTADLVGHSQGRGEALGKGMGSTGQQDIVKAFRLGTVNLLVATSVAEEGLDFPSCDLVVRFDPLQHMVGYLQSRGRARSRTSTFVVMVQEGNETHLSRYLAFSQAEPELKQYYQEQSMRELTPEPELEEGEVEEEADDPDDLAARERYVVPSTLSVLTYHSAIAMLGHLCSIIPRDRYTPAHAPKYIGDFAVTLKLPSCLPLPAEYLIYAGPMRKTKKEAKAAVAFMAVKKLHELGVFDDYLLPVRAGNEDLEDADGRRIPPTRHIPDMMEVSVHDPWVMGTTLWRHVITVNGNATAALITGTRLPPTGFRYQGDLVRLWNSKRVVLDMPRKQREIMQEYTRTGLWWCCTGRGIRSVDLACYLVPITSYYEPDYDLMERTNAHPYGIPSWEGVSEKEYPHILCINHREFGRPLIIHRIRYDLTPMSTPLPGTPAAGYATYHEFWVKKWARKGVPADVPEDGPLAEVYHVPRRIAASFSLPHLSADAGKPTPKQPTTFFVPFAFLRRADLSGDIWRTYHLLPRIIHRATGVYRALRMRAELGLPPIPTDLLVEATTLPSTTAGWSNQRLETLGDSVLKIAAIVYLLNKFRYRHEGQLDHFRVNAVSNVSLLARAKEVGLEHYLSSESVHGRAWRWVLPEEAGPETLHPVRRAMRIFARKSLADCMEAILGAAFLHGGMDTALQAGASLGLCMGGPLPLGLHYGRKPAPRSAAALYNALQAELDYEFHDGEILAEASRHPSFDHTGLPSYQRLEFLGDAVIDFVVVHYLYRKFPQATSGQMTRARAYTVCTATLAYIAVRRLKLHKTILVNSVDLSVSINKYVEIFENITPLEMVLTHWKYDPPKALADVMESTMAAILIDTGYNYEKTEAAVQQVMSDVLEVLTPDLPPDPVSQLMIWTARAGCRMVRFRKTMSNPAAKSNNSVAIMVHDVSVCGPPIVAATVQLAKALASERALEILQDESAPTSLKNLCNCDKLMAIDSDPPAPATADDETTQGFATLASQKLRAMDQHTTELEEGEVDDDGEVFDMDLSD